MGHAVGIDVGSSNVKAALVAGDGTLVASTSRPLAMHRQGAVAEQDAESVWTAVVDAVVQLTGEHPAAASDVETLGVASQYSSIVPVAADGAALAPMRMYFDTRGTQLSMAVLERHPEAFTTWLERHGIPPVGSGLSLGHMLHLQHEDPSTHERTAAWLEPMDFVNLRLTGRATATQATAFAGQVCDNRSLGATAYDADLVRMAGIDADRLPPLVAVDATIGTLLPAVADRLGLPVGVTVTAGMNDSQAGAVATGAALGGRVGLAVGTTAVVLDTIDHLAVDLDHEVLSMPDAFPDRYLVWAENGVAGKAVEHLLDGILLASDALAEGRGGSGFDALDQVMAATSPGAGGVLFLPWLAGSLAPSADRHMRGGFLDLSLDTSRLDLVRAAVEGTAHNVAWLLPAVEQFTGRRADEIVFGGGAARSAGWAQVMADVLARPVSTLRDPGTATARAVALVALQRAGMLAAGDLASTVTTAATYEPDPSTRDLYAADQADFEAAFTALRPILTSRNRGR